MQADSRETRLADLTVKVHPDHFSHNRTGSLTPFFLSTVALFLDVPYNGTIDGNIATLRANSRKTKVIFFTKMFMGQPKPSSPLPV